MLNEGMLGRCLQLKTFSLFFQEFISKLLTANDIKKVLKMPKNSSDVIVLGSSPKAVTDLSY